MLLNDLLKQDDSRRAVEGENFVEFSKRTVRFGDELYQLRNVTGIEAGELPKGKFPFLPLLCSGFALGIALVFCSSNHLDSYAAFLLTIPFVGLFIVVFMFIILGYYQSPGYGLIMSFNSGKSTSFSSNDKRFLGDIVSVFYRLIEGDIDGMVVNIEDRSIHITQDRSMHVNSAVKGNFSTGDNTENSYQKNN